MTKPLSLEEIRKQHKPIRNINLEHKEQLSNLEKFAIWITEHIGSMGFFILVFAWTVFWLIWNIAGPEELKFDPFPAFVLWLFISNTIQILLMPLIMIGQNLQNRHLEARATADFNVNTRAEKEIEVIVQHLENQSELIQKVANDLESLKQK